MRTSVRDAAADTGPRQHNVPSVDEIAAVIAASGNDMEVNDGRDILLRKQTGGVGTNQQCAPCIRASSLRAPFPVGTPGPAGTPPFLPFAAHCFY
jgi:hypothetical protein